MGRWRQVCASLLVLLCQLVYAQFKVVGYLPSWAGNVSDVQFSKLTHINYAFALPTPTGGLQSLGGGAAKLQSLVSAGHAAGKKVLMRGMKPLCAKDVRTFYMAHYDMDHSTDQSRRAFLEKVRRRVARI